VKLSKFTVLCGMITSGHTLGYNQGAAAVADTIREKQLKWTPLWSGSWSRHNQREAAVYKCCWSGLLDSPKMV